MSVCVICDVSPELAVDGSVKSGNPGGKRERCKRCTTTEDETGLG